MLAWLSAWSEVQTCIWPSWCHCHSLSLASVKSRLVLPFWYWLTWVVLEKGAVKRVCACVCVCVLLPWAEYCWFYGFFSVIDLSCSPLISLVGRQEEHPACKNWVMWCWCGYLSGARCRLFAHGSADATAIPEPYHLLPHLNPDWFYFSGTGLPRF